MTYKMNFSTRDEFPEFLNECELKGTGAEIGVQNGSYSEKLLDNWNVINVKSMMCMFHGANSFNQPLNNWNVSNVKDMRLMFYDVKLLPEWYNITMF